MYMTSSAHQSRERIKPHPTTKAPSSNNNQRQSGVTEESNIIEILKIGEILIKDIEENAVREPAKGRRPIKKQQKIAASDFSFTQQEVIVGESKVTQHRQSNSQLAAEAATNRESSRQLKWLPVSSHSQIKSQKPIQTSSNSSRLYAHVASKVFNKVSPSPNISYTVKTQTATPQDSSSLSQTKTVLHSNESQKTTGMFLKGENRLQRKLQTQSSLERRDIYYRSIEQLKAKNLRIEEQKASRQALVEIYPFRPRINNNIALNGSFEERLATSKEKSKRKQLMLLQQQLDKAKQKRVQTVTPPVNPAVNTASSHSTNSNPPNVASVKKKKISPIEVLLGQNSFQSQPRKKDKQVKPSGKPHKVIQLSSAEVSFLLQ